MSEPKKSGIEKKTNRKDRGQKPQVMFYGGLKSNNELYFQMASLFREATKGDQSLSGEWMGRIMASQATKSSGKFF